MRPCKSDQSALHRLGPGPGRHEPRPRLRQTAAPRPGEGAAAGARYGAANQVEAGTEEFAG